MRTYLSSVALTLIAFVVAGCTVAPLSPLSGDTASSSSTEALPVAREMVYEGVVQAMQDPSADGTHHLLLPDGSFVSLQSSTQGLDEFVGENVRVYGSVRPALTGQGESMRVSRVELVLMPEQSSSSSDSASSVSSDASSASSVQASVAASRGVSSSVRSSSRSSVSSAAVSASSQASVTMKPVKTDAALWTRQYCSAYAGFCFPVHKNWWFKSFGTTASALQHIEVSDTEIDMLGSGPLSVDLTSGGLPSGVADGAVVPQGDGVTGYRLWTGGKHFEVRGPASMQAAIAYITQNITTYEAPAP